MSVKLSTLKRRLEAKTPSQLLLYFRGQQGMKKEDLIEAIGDRFDRDDDGLTTIEIIEKYKYDLVEGYIDMLSSI